MRTHCKLPADAIRVEGRRPGLTAAPVRVAASPKGSAPALPWARAVRAARMAVEMQDGAVRAAAGRA